MRMMIKVTTREGMKSNMRIFLEGTQTLTLVRSSALPSATFSPPIAVSGRRNSAALPRYSGLRLRPAAETSFPTHASSRTASRGGGVKCEAGDTAVEG